MLNNGREGACASLSTTACYMREMGLQMRAMANSAHHNNHGAGGHHQTSPLAPLSALLAASPSPSSFPHHPHLPVAESSDVWRDEPWTVDCPCGVNFDDGDEMVECDDCNVWVHTACCRVPKGLATFVCDKCKSKKKSEDEVVQLLVDFPNTARAGILDVGVNEQAQLAIEERVHVHGVPGGDARIFMGASKILRQLWKHSGYVPKTFQVEYDEFADFRGLEVESCLFSIKSTAEEADGRPVETSDKAKLAEDSDKCREGLNSEEPLLSKELEVKAETQKVDLVPHGKNRQRLRGAKEERLQQRGKHGRDESAGKDEISNKKAKVCPAEIDLVEEDAHRQCPSTSASQQISPKNPKTMKKSAVQEFMDGGTGVCSKCGKLETLLPAESVNQFSSGDPEALLCRNCEKDSNFPKDGVCQHDKLAHRQSHKVADSSSIDCSWPKCVEVKVQDVKGVNHLVESSAVGENTKNIDQHEQVQLGDRDNAELEDQNIDPKLKKLEGPQSMENILESRLENVKNPDAALRIPTTVFDTNAGCTIGATCEVKMSLGIPARTTENLTGSTYSNVMPNSDTPTDPIKSQYKLQMEHDFVGLMSAAPPSAFSNAESEDLLQPLPSGINLESVSDEKQSTFDISTISKDKHEEHCRVSVEKFSVGEQLALQPREAFGIYSQQQVEPQHQDDSLLSRAVESPHDSTGISSGKKPHSDKHPLELLDARSPHKSHAEFDPLNNNDAMTQIESKPNIDCKMQSRAQRPVSLHLDVNETALSELESPKAPLQQQVPNSPSNQKIVTLSLPSKTSNSSTKSQLVHPNKPTSSSGVKPVAASTPGRLKSSNAAKQPGIVGSSQSKNHDSASLSSFRSSSVVRSGETTALSAHSSRNDMKPPTNVAHKLLSTKKPASQSHTLKPAVVAPKVTQSLSTPKQPVLPALGKKVSLPVSSMKSSVMGGAGKPKSGQLNKKESLDSSSKDDRIPPSVLPGSKADQCPGPPSPLVTTAHSTATPSAIPATPLNDEEELNSSPRVPRVPRVRQVIMSPQRSLSNRSISMAVKGAPSVSISASAGGNLKENRTAWRKRMKDEHNKDGSNQAFVGNESNKGCEPASQTSPDRKEEEANDSAGGYGSSRQPLVTSHEDGCPKKENSPSPAAPPQQSVSVSLGRSSTVVESGHGDEVTGERRKCSDVPLTLSGLIKEFLSNNEVQASYDDICDATLPYWQKLLKANGERYTYLTHRQAVYDCLRSNSSWAYLVDQAPKMVSSKRKHRYDSSSATECESEEDADLGSSYSLEHLEFQRPGRLSRIHEGERIQTDRQKDVENHLDDVPKGKRKARRRRKLAIEDESEDDEDYVEKLKEIPKLILQGKSVGLSVAGQEVPFSGSIQASSNSSEDEEEEMVVHRGVRRIRKRIKGRNSS